MRAGSSSVSHCIAPARAQNHITQHVALQRRTLLGGHAIIRSHFLPLVSLASLLPPFCKKSAIFVNRRPINDSCLLRATARKATSSVASLTLRNLRKEISALIDQWVEENTSAMLAR
jgi:hypothetical protein